MHESVHVISYIIAWKLIVELVTETDHNGAEENHQADEFNLEMKEGGSTVGADENHQAHEDQTAKHDRQPPEYKWNILDTQPARPEYI